MKHILFAHGNFPGQFRHLITYLSEQAEYKVYFITDKKDVDSKAMPGIRIRTMKETRNISEGIHHYLTTSERDILSGQKVVRAIIELLAEGVKPDIVISHGGMGLGMFIKDILPDCKHIGLFEWYFKSTTSKYLFREFDFDKQLRIRCRNLTILSELQSCDAAVIPSNWQKIQFPVEYYNKVNTIFDGVDNNFFNSEYCEPSDISLYSEEIAKGIVINKDELILSYATRGMEPLRGFMEFVRGSIEVLKTYKKAKVIIGGRDRCAYSYGPLNFETWKAEAVTLYKENNINDRVIFTGLMDYGNYRKLLRRTNLHCYFTRPYVTSWSLFEAAASGARLCISLGGATENIISKESIVEWVNLDSQEEINESLKKAIVNKQLKTSLKSCYFVGESLRQWIGLIERLTKEN